MHFWVNMKYDFPEALTLDEVSRVVNEHNEHIGARAFLEVERSDFIAYDYAFIFDGVFPDVTDRVSAILRECRGLIMCKRTGNVLARRLHKFWNLNEKSETRVENLDFSSPHVVLDKLDGSMITPLMLKGRIRWGTRMGPTEVSLHVEKFVENRPEYDRFALREMENGRTPIFEWCSRKQRIVIDYPVDKLVLTAIRDMHTGEYVPYDEMVELAKSANIPVVDALATGVEDVDAFVAHTRGLLNAEGYIVRFADGHMLKIKADHYCRLHRTKSEIAREKDVLALIIQNRLDDIIPLLDGPDREDITNYATIVNRGISNVARRVEEIVARAKKEVGDNRKDFALNVVAKQPDTLKPILFRVWDGFDPMNAVRVMVEKNLKSQSRVDSIRSLWGGVEWKRAPLEE